VTMTRRCAASGAASSVDAAKVHAMKAQGLGASEIAKALKIASSAGLLFAWGAFCLQISQKVCLHKLNVGNAGIGDDREHCKQH
jgi:hypothetical protein